MKFEKFNRKNVGDKRSGIPYLRVSKSGTGTLSLEACKKLQLQAGDEVEFFFEKKDAGRNEVKYVMYISKAIEKGASFNLKQNKNFSAGVYFQSSGMIHMMIERLDLAVGDDKKPSVRLDIDFKNPVTYENQKLFKVY